MATHKSAEKAARQAIKRRNRNQAVRSEFKNAIKQFRTAVSVKTTNVEEVRTKLVPMLNHVQSLLMKAAKRKVSPKETASRQISRLSTALHKIANQKSA